MVSSSVSFACVDKRYIYIYIYIYIIYSLGN
jgi:hypothetical protein